MARSTKHVNQRQNPKGRSFGIQIPDDFSKTPISWRFSFCDMDRDCRWSLYSRESDNFFWAELVDKLKEFEGMTPADIFIGAKHLNHPICVSSLSTAAVTKLAELHIEAEALYSLRLSGKRRLYGLLDGAAFNIIWYDDDHGDNDHCVCRSYKKHT